MGKNEGMANTQKRQVHDVWLADKKDQKLHVEHSQTCFLFDLLGGQCMKGKALPSSSRLQPLVSGLIGSSMRTLLAFLTRGSKMSLLNDMLAKRH